MSWEASMAVRDGDVVWLGAVIECFGDRICKAKYRERWLGTVR